MASARRRRDARNRAFRRAHESDPGADLAQETASKPAPAAKPAWKPSNIAGQRRPLMWYTGIAAVFFFLYGLYVVGRPLWMGWQHGFDSLTQMTVQPPNGPAYQKSGPIRELVSMEFGRAAYNWFFSVVLLTLCLWHRKHWKSGT